MNGDRLGRRDYAWSLAVLLALALPLMPVPGDGAAHMRVHFHAPGMAEARQFSARTTQSLCSMMEMTLAYDDPATGNFTRISCDE